MGNLCGKSHKEPQQHDVGRKRADDGHLNPLNPHRPTAAAPVRPVAGMAGSAGGVNGASAAGHAPGAGATDVPSGNAASTMPARRNEIDEWYNVLVRKLWPFINPAVTKMANEMLPDLLQQSKPTWMTRLEMTKFQLGDNPIELTKLDVADGPDPGQDDIYLDFDIRWDAPHLDFELAVNPLPKFMAGLPGIKQATSITVGVEDFFLEGRVRISMVPLIKEIPVVGALQISLLEMPKFDMNLTLGVFDGLESTIKPWLKSFVEDFVLEAYELPGHYFLPLANGIPDVQTPAGVMELTVVEAVNVPKMDYFSQSSPYCKLWLTGAKKNAVKTPYVDTTKNPKWDPARSTFGFAVHAPDHQQLVVALYDYDGVGADDEIGRTMISLKDLGDEQAQDFWVSFETPEQAAERKKHEELLAEGKSEHDVKHRDQDGNKKGILQRTQDAVVKTLVPAAGGHDKQLPDCRVRIKAIYHSLEEADVRRLNVAQNEGRKPDITMIHEATTRKAVERFGLMDQIVSAKKEPGQAGGAGQSGAQGEKDRAGEDSAQPQGGQAQATSGGVGSGGVGSGMGGGAGGVGFGRQGGAGAGNGFTGAQVLGGGKPGQPVGALGGPGRNVVGVGAPQRVPGPQGLSQLA